MKQLTDVEQALGRFFAQGVLLLEEKLGPILWQLPPRMRFSPAKLEAFLRLLPTDTEEAQSLAQGDVRLSEHRPLRHALEVRNPTFACAQLLDMLRAYDVALVVSDSGRRWPCADELTSGFVYVRLHGVPVLYRSAYVASRRESGVLARRHHGLPRQRTNATPT